VATNSLDRLTERQRHVLFYICKGFHNREIADHTGLSPRTVKGCVRDLLLIFDVSNRTELVGMLALESSALSSIQG
jgi:DNA-binding NarL/FixJ family response regulator